MLNEDAYFERLYREYDAKQAEQEEELERFPRCSECHETIMDDWLFDINDELLCWNCLKKNHRKWTVDYCVR